MTNVETFPMNVYVRYIDIFEEDGDEVCRRFPISSVTTGPDLVRALRCLGFLSDEDRWIVQHYSKNGFMNLNGLLWYTRDMLWINDRQEEFAGYLLCPCEWAAEDGMEVPDTRQEWKDKYGNNVELVDFGGRGVPEDNGENGYSTD